MKKLLISAALAASTLLAGCVAVPTYGDGYYGRPYYYDYYGDAWPYYYSDVYVVPYHYYPRERFYGRAGFYGGYHGGGFH